MVMNQNTRIVDITVGELTDIIKSLIPTGIVKEEKPKEKWLVHGREGLAELFGCSKKHADTIRNSGVIDKAVSRIGKIIVVDAEKALELTRTSNPKKYK
jgi:hypothetical protein